MLFQLKFMYSTKLLRPIIIEVLKCQNIFIKVVRNILNNFILVLVLIKRFNNYSCVFKNVIINFIKSNNSILCNIILNISIKYLSN